MIKKLIKKFTPSFLLGWYHLCLAFLGAFLYGFPSRKLIVIGVTGTKGKSTVVDFCHRIFETAGFKVASLSSIRFKINDRERPNLLKMTMPGRFQIQKFFRQAVDQGCKYMILEVTSEGILQHRHQFIDFNTAVFVNLSPEHIERHGSFEKYREAKGKLFQITKNIHVINIDDQNAEYFLQFPARKKYTFGLDQGDINKEKVGSLNLKLLGGFNFYNAMAAICVGLSQGISLETCKQALEKIETMPGRMEIVVEKPFKVIVDYAHIPDALEKVYQSLEPSRLICVLGSAGGGRDKWKRPKMGEIAAKYCSDIILTNEDPYDEDPLEILHQVESGTGASRSPVIKILDRREAISQALKRAKPDDTVIITGKGCEPWMCVKDGKKIPWDDRKIVREEYAKI